MKYNNFIAKSALVVALAMAATACSDDINYGNNPAPEVGDGSPLLYVTDAEGGTQLTTVEMRDTKDVELFVNATAPLATANTVTFAYDATALAAYNRANGTSYEAVPESMVSFPDGASATLAAGALKSEAVTMTITSDGSLDYSKGYVVPLTVSVNGGAELALMSQSRMIVLKDLTALPDCNKTVIDANGNEVAGIKVFSCMEVNDTNPLNNLKYTLKNSGKYLVDALIIFSANVNYNEETGRVYVLCNENVQALLDNREKYLKPLQDRGMKVILGLLGNHDRSGVANLSEEAARAYAKEIKALCDAYNLDGVFYDDEYSSYQNPVPAGFVSPSRAAASRLIYEVWKVQPERWNVAYCYSRTYGLNEVDGVQAGTYCQYALHDYGGSSDLSNYFPGMPKSNMGLYSQEFNLGRFANANNLRNLRNNGYGSHMIFAMDPNRSNVWNQENSLKNMAEIFYDDELVIDPTNYTKDW